MSLSLRAAINAKCKDCLYDPAAFGSWRWQIAVCTVTACPLWPVRPAPMSCEVPRDPENLPARWLQQGQEEAVRTLRAKTRALSAADPDLPSAATGRDEAVGGGEGL